MGWKLLTFLGYVVMALIVLCLLYLATIISIWSITTLTTIHLSTALGSLTVEHLLSILWVWLVVAVVYNLICLLAAASND